MTDYDFPHITHIDEVRSAIKDRKDFIEANRGDYIIFNYRASNPTQTFPEVTDKQSAILRECRGITFCATSGRVVARKFHKFFNVNERSETKAGKVDLEKNHHVILEKLDGSMISPFRRKDASIEWHTKMGATDVAKLAEDFVLRNPHYNDFASSMLDAGCTPLFEFCSQKSQIVVFHPQDRLVLLAVRENESGMYRTYLQLQGYANRYKIELVQEFPGSVESMQDLIDQTRALTDAEGYVLRFDDGHMLKVKGDWYTSLHRSAKGGVRQEVELWKHAVEGTLDDVKALADERDRVALETFENRFWKGFDDIRCKLLKVYDYQKEIDKELGYVLEAKRLQKAKRAVFGREFAPSFGPLEPLAFAVFEGGDPHDVIKGWVVKHTNNSKALERIRPHFGSLNWDDIRSL